MLIIDLNSKFFLVWDWINRYLLNYIKLDNKFDLRCKSCEVCKLKTWGDTQAQVVLVSWILF